MRQTTEAGFAGYPTPRAVLFVPLVRPMMRCIMAGMDQEYSSVGVAWWQLLRFRSCSSSQVVDYSFVLQRQLSMVPPCRKTTEISQLQCTVTDVPDVRSSRIFPCRGGVAVLWSRLFVGPFSSTVAVHDGRCPCCAGRAFSWCRRLGDCRDLTAAPWCCWVDGVIF